MFSEQDLREAFLAGMKVQQDTDIINGMFFEEYLDHLKSVAEDVAQLNEKNI